MSRRISQPRPPSVWWLSPVGAVALLVPVTLYLAARMSDSAFREAYRTPKSLTGSTVALFAAGALVFTLGALITVRKRSGGPAIRPMVLTSVQRQRLHRAAGVLFWLTITGYAAFAASGIVGGVRLSDVLAVFATQQNDAGNLKEQFGSITGVTTLTQMGMAFIVVAVILLSGGRDRGLAVRVAVVLTLGLLRAFLLNERLAILELVVPAVVLMAVRLAGHRGPRARWFVRAAPVYLLPLVLVVFGAFEYSRSWVYYSSHSNSSFAEFTVSRLAGYYVTAYNNGELLLRYESHPGRVPYESLSALWTAPGMKQIDAYKRFAGPEDAAGRDGEDALLQQYGNPEFNSPGGLAIPFVDYGPAGGLVFLLVAGLVVGITYRRFADGRITAVLVYPVLVTGLFELPRYLYWTQGRVTPSLAALLAIAWWLHREARVPAQPDAPDPFAVETVRPTPALTGTTTQKSDPMTMPSPRDATRYSVKQIAPQSPVRGDAGRASVAAQPSMSKSRPGTHSSADRPASRNPSRPVARDWLGRGVASLVICALAGALLFAGIGFVWATAVHRYTVTALISIQPDPVLLNGPDVSSSDAQDRFVQSQVILMNSAQSTDEVARRLGLGDTMTLTATQLGNTNVVQVVGVAPTASSAEQVADTAITVYGDMHKRDIDARAKSTLDLVDAQIAANRKSEVGLSGATAQREALNTEYMRLLAVPNQIAMARLQAEKGTSIVQSGAAVGARRTSNPVQRAALLALLGAVLGLGLAILARRASPRIHNAAVLAELDHAPLLPRTPRLAKNWPYAIRTGEPVTAAQRAGRLQLGQIVGGSGRIGHPPLMVISASSGAGGSVVALHLAVLSARRHRTLLLVAGNLNAEQSAALGIDSAETAYHGGGQWTVDRIARLALATQVPGLFVLPLGAGATQNDADIDATVADGLLEVAEVADWDVVVDCPALDRSTLGLTFAERGCRAVVVVGLNESTEPDAVDSLRTLRRSGATVSGVVVNQPRHRSRRWHDGS